ncbi:MAG TPA: helix-turn-helix domain-containing protein [Solirubrobacteraceae bacterium]|jgi:cytoskeleton protein RodZ|nr:helix-turn-helix domain-containing protein [Solirubrobacteraceae bacterium]
MPEIGATLREARMRARLDVSEIEAKTKIRAKYLRALENEEWSLLPGSTFVKSFLRTYAQALGLDGRALVEEYRLHHERPSETAFDPIVSTGGRPPGQGRQRVPGSGPSRAYMASVAVVGLVIVLLIVLLISGGGSSKNPTTSTTAAKTKAKHAARHATAAPAGGQAGAPPLVALSLKPTAEVYVCLIGDNGRKLVPGTTLTAGASTPTFHARHFKLNLGNNAVTLYINGRPRSVPASSQAIGYSITKANGRQPLAPGELPTCK